jgi:hypothetical protein
LAIPTPKQNETVAQIIAAWQEAQSQLAVLREQVAYATELAKAKVQSSVLTRELEVAYRNLGEAVWAEVSRGKLALPTNLSSVKKALQEVTQRIQEQNASVNDLLAEGEDVALRLRQKIDKASKPVAPPQKKR